MSFDELHNEAVKRTPQEVDVPKNWAGLFIWAVGKWGTGAVFLALLLPVYLDFKASNAQFIAQSQATVQAIQNLANKIDNDRQFDAVVMESIRRLETALDRTKL